jgi:hypothetical protein
LSRSGSRHICSPAGSRSDPLRQHRGESPWCALLAGLLSLLLVEFVPQGEFDGQPIDGTQARRLISRAQALLGQVNMLAG